MQNVKSVIVILQVIDACGIDRCRLNISSMIFSDRTTLISHSRIVYLRSMAPFTILRENFTSESTQLSYNMLSKLIVTHINNTWYTVQLEGVDTGMLKLTYNY